MKKENVKLTIKDEEIKTKAVYTLEEKKRLVSNLQKEESKVTSVSLKNDRIPSMKVIRETKAADLSYRSYIDIVDMIEENSAHLMTLKAKDLKAICKELDTKVSGNKSTKTKSILGALSDIISKVSFKESCEIPSSAIALDYILNNGLEKLIAFKQVLAMAYKGYPVYEADKIVAYRPHECFESCRILLERGQADTTWSDVYQCVSIALIEQGQNCIYPSIKNGFPVLTPEIFRAIRREIGTFFRSMRMSGKYQPEESLEVLICEDNGDSEKIVKCGKKSDSAYIQALAVNVPELSDIISSDFVPSFFKWLGGQDKYKKYFLPMVEVFNGLTSGMKYGDIMDTYGISRRIFDRCRAELKSAYQEFGKLCYDSHMTSSATYGCTYRMSETSASGSYEYSYFSGNPYQIAPTVPTAPIATTGTGRVKNVLTGREYIRPYDGKKIDTHHITVKKTDKDDLRKEPINTDSNIHTYYDRKGRTYHFQNGQPIYMVK